MSIDLFLNRRYFSNTLKEVVKTCLFSLSVSENKVNRGADKRDRRNDSPQGFFTHRTEIFLKAVHNGPNRQEKEGNGQQNDNTNCF